MFDKLRTRAGLTAPVPITAFDHLPSSFRLEAQRQFVSQKVAIASTYLVGALVEGVYAVEDGNKFALAATIGTSILSGYNSAQALEHHNAVNAQTQPNLAKD